MQVAHLLRAEQSHASLNLVSEDLKHSLDTLVAVTCLRVQNGSSEANAAGTQTHSFQNVGSSTNASVNMDLEVGILEKVGSLSVDSKQRR